MHHSIEAYRETYTELLKKTRPLLKGLVLMTPFVLERNKEDDMRAMMDAHGAVVRELAGEFDAVFVDTQAAMDEFMQHYHPTSIAWDRIHPNPSGHMTLAMAVLRSFKVDLGATS
jgi:lysophospholipase L1-like esterase